MNALRELMDLVGTALDAVGVVVVVLGVLVSSARFALGARLLHHRA